MNEHLWVYTDDEWKSFVQGLPPVDPRRGVPREVYDQLSELLDRIRSANGRNYRTPVPVPDSYVEV